MRSAIRDVRRYIVTVENSPIRYFTFLESDILPDQKLRVFASDDALVLGVLSTIIHGTFATRIGGCHGVANTPVYNTKCATLFPFPVCDEPTKTRIRELAEELDAHRKRVQAAHGLTLTGLYNVLEKLRANEPLTDKDRTIHEKGLVSTLKQLHDDLDLAVLHAYGWDDLLTVVPTNATPESRKAFEQEILKRLVALNAQRAAEEKQGHIRWLRPDYQNPQGTGTQTGLALKTTKKAAKKAPVSKAKTAWPKTLPERMRATEQALQSIGHPVTAAELAKRFSRAKAEDLQELLETLAVMGRAHEDGGKFKA